MTPSELANQVRRLIREGLLEDAIALLCKELPKDQAVLSVSGRYHEMKRNERTLTYEALKIDKEQVRQDTLKIADHLEGKVGEAVPPKQGKVVSAGARNIAKVIGRGQDLEAIVQQLAPAGGQLLWLNGIGGIGKTTLARAYFNDYAARYHHRFWLVFSQNLKNTLVQGLNSLPELGFEGEIDEIFTQVHNYLSNLSGSKLLVIDNVDEANDLSDLPHLLPSFDLLITSRLRLGSDVPHQPLGALNPADSLALFYAHYKGKSNDEALESLLELIGRHTLTTELLAKTASVGELTIDELLTVWQEKQLQAPDLEFNVRTPYRKTQEAQLRQVLLAAFDLAALTPAEQSLLRQFALMPPAIAVPTATLQHLLQITHKKDLLNPLHSLANKGWLERITADGEYPTEWQTHSIVQTTLLAYLPPSYVHHESLVNQVIELLYIDNTKDNPVDKFAWLPWGQHLLKHLPDIPLDALGELQNHLGRVYKAFGDYDEARELLEQALESALAHFGANHQKVAIRQSNLGIIYKNLGDYDKAIELLDAALENALSNLGSKHPKVAIRQSNLATVYKSLGKYNKACELIEAALAIDIEHFGLNHPTIAIRQSNLAEAYQGLGAYDKACELLEISLKNGITHLGANNPKVVLRQSRLAEVHRALGEESKAVELWQQAYATFRDTLGEEHPYTQKVKRFLGL